MSSRVEELARKYIELRTKRQQLEQEADDIKMEMDQISQEMVPIMEGLDAQNLKIKGVGTIYLQTAFYVQAVKEKAEELVAWLDAKGLGHLAKRSVHASTLKSEYQRWADEDLPLPPPELVTAFPKTEVRIRKSN